MTDKKIRVQFDMSEIKALIYHLNMEIDSLMEVYNDLVKLEHEKKTLHEVMASMDLAKRIKAKLIRVENKHLTD